GGGVPPAAPLRPARCVRQRRPPSGARRAAGRRPPVLGVAGRGADRAGVAIGGQGGGLLPGPAVGAAVDGAGRPFAARFRRGGGGAAGGRWLGVLLPLARGPRQLERQQRSEVGEHSTRPNEALQPTGAAIQVRPVHWLSTRPRPLNLAFAEEAKAEPTG